jgi:hypothetical protein
MKKLFAVALILSTALPGFSTQYSKLAIVTASKSIGKWGELKSFIASAGMVDEWQACDYLSDEHELFATVTNAIVNSGLVTAAELKEILEKSKDPAIADALIGRAYSSDMANAAGRVKWHGKVVSTTYDTNKLVKVQTHEDGFVYRAPFSPSRPPSVESQLTAAERAAKAEALRKERERQREEKRQARIAELQTNLQYHVEQTMAAKRWPEDLSRLYLQHELNTLIGTNVVNAVIAPE